MKAARWGYGIVPYGCSTVMFKSYFFDPYKDSLNKFNFFFCCLLDKCFNPLAHDYEEASEAGFSTFSPLNIEYLDFNQF